MPNEGHLAGPLLAPSGGPRGLHAGAEARWAAGFAPRRASIVRVSSRSTDPAGRSRSQESAKRLTAALANCIVLPARCSTLLRIGALPVPVDKQHSGCRSPRAVRIGRRGICGHSALWQQAHIGMQPDVASGRCVQGYACVMRAFPVGVARQRDRMRTLRATCIAKRTVRYDLVIIRPMHVVISVWNPQAPGPRSRSALCSRRRRYDARRSPIFAAHLGSDVLCSQWMQARGGISLVAIADLAWMPGQRIFISEKGVPVYSFFFDLDGWSQGTSPFDFRHYRQTRFGHARSKRGRPAPI